MNVTPGNFVKEKGASPFEDKAVGFYLVTRVTTKGYKVRPFCSPKIQGTWEQRVRLKWLDQKYSHKYEVLDFHDSIKLLWTKIPTWRELK
jgi:hypothetical protein